MLRCVVALKGLQCDEKGVTAVEYGLIVALIAAVIFATVATLGTNLGTTYNNVAANFSNIGK